jgi:hypothetical protein
MRKLLIAVVIALLCALALMAGCKTSGSDPETQQFAWESVDLSGLGLTAWGLEDVHMVSASEGWAVGRRVPGAGGNLPVVLHYHNGAWTEDNPVDDLPALDGQLYGVNVAPNGEVWCVGTDDAGTSAVVIIRSAAGAWEQVAAGEGWPTQLRSVTFDSDGNAVAAGGSMVVIFSGHAYAGTVDLPIGSTAYGIDWVGHGFVVGSDATGAAIWEGPDYAANETDADSQLFDLDLASDGSGWAVGQVSGATHAPLLIRHSGSTWTQAAFTLSGSNILTGVSLVSSVEGWAVGYEGDLNEPDQGLLLLWQSGAWSDQSAGIRALGIAGNWSLNAVSALSTLETWAVGRNNTAGTGLILHYGPQ